MLHVGLEIASYISALFLIGVAAYWITRAFLFLSRRGK